jgi:histidinol-phosphatase (PHP family)
MPFSQHSHSGQFCPGHAANALRECIEAAISARLLVFGLTEHMPRHAIDFYPEELSSNPPATLEGHFENEERYVVEALRLREVFKGRIELPLGFECDWIRKESRELIERSIKRYHGKWDYLVGSVHHVHAVPIDYDQSMYDEAREKAGGSDERLFEDYFDRQLEMLKAVRPVVVGHFDLVRLKSQDPDVSGGWQSMKGVWERMLRNLDVVAEYGGILEVNTAALRKEMKEPYPKEEVIRVSLPGNR